MRDLSNQRFGKWTVTAKSDERKHGQVCWEVKCDCGNTGVLTGAVLRKGKSKSCGCYRDEAKRTHGMYQTPIHRVWSNMIQRCHNPNNKAYPNYGGRGIAVCDRWRNSFEAFFQDMGDVPFKGAQIDRINNDLGYRPQNCQWVTRSGNQSNTRYNHHLTHNGKTQNVAAWSRETGIPHSTIRARLLAGKSVEQALTKSVPRGT